MDLEAEIAIGERPLFGEFAGEFPLTAAAFAAEIARICAFPKRGISLGPDGLRIGAAEDDIAPAFELFAIAGVKNGKVFPLGG